MLEKKTPEVPTLPHRAFPGATLLEIGPVSWSPHFVLGAALLFFMTWDGREGGVFVCRACKGQLFAIGSAAGWMMG